MLGNLGYSTIVEEMQNVKEFCDYDADTNCIMYFDDNSDNLDNIGSKIIWVTNNENYSP